MTAIIQATFIKNKKTGELERIDYEWIGNKRDKVRIPSYRHERSLMKRLSKNVYQLGQFRLRLVNQDFFLIDGFYARICVLLYPLICWLEVVYCKLVVTLAVWGIALPDWKDIRLFKKSN